MYKFNLTLEVEVEWYEHHQHHTHSNREHPIASWLILNYLQNKFLAPQGMFPM